MSKTAKWSFSLRAERWSDSSSDEGPQRAFQPDTPQPQQAMSESIEHASDSAKRNTAEEGVYRFKPFSGPAEAGGVGGFQGGFQNSLGLAGSHAVRGLETDQARMGVEAGLRREYMHIQKKN